MIWFVEFSYWMYLLVFGGLKVVKCFFYDLIVVLWLLVGIVVLVFIGYCYGWFFGFFVLYFMGCF